MADKKLERRIDLHKLSCPWCRQPGAPEPMAARPGDKLESGEGEPVYLAPTYLLSREEAERLFPRKLPGTFPAAESESLKARKARARAAVQMQMQEWWHRRLAELTADEAAAARRQIMGIDLAEPGSDYTVSQIWSPWMRPGEPTHDDIEEAVEEIQDPVRVVMVELFDGRVLYVAGDYEAEDRDPGQMGSRVQRVIKQALACYSEAELHSARVEWPALSPAKCTMDTWPRARFEALPEEYGFGRIVDGVWPADALRIPGVCPRTDNHHRPADRGRFCSACGRGRGE